MLGGTSAEREVSLDTGAAVLKALQSRGVDAHAWDPAEQDLIRFSAAGFDRVWNALHGTGGEDGALQGALQWLDVPYTGSGVMASALAMDKVRSKHLFEASGIPTPEYAVVRHEADAILAAESLGFPMILKPAGRVRASACRKFFEREDLSEAVSLALAFGGIALAERCIVGGEYTVGVLQEKHCPAFESKRRACSTTIARSMNRIARNTTAPERQMPKPKRYTRGWQLQLSMKLAVAAGSG